VLWWQGVSYQCFFQYEIDVYCTAIFHNMQSSDMKQHYNVPNITRTLEPTLKCTGHSQFVKLIFILLCYCYVKALKFEFFYRFARSPEEKIQQTSKLTQFTFSATKTHSFVYRSNAVGFHSMTFLMLWCQIPIYLPGWNICIGTP